MPQLLLWLAAWAAGESASFERRVDALQAVERARYAFTLDAAVPFEQAHSREVLEKRAAREIREEFLLAERFGIRVSPEMLAAELQRIERQTQDPGQWEAVKRALGDDLRRVEDIVCRPLIIQRRLRQRFAFDESIHEEALVKARQARRLFIEVRSVEGMQVLKLARGSGTRPDIGNWLAEAKLRAKGPRVLSSPEERREPSQNRLVPLHPEAAQLLESQLRHSGDVSTVLSEAHRFAVYRLVEKTDDAWTVQAAIFAKRDFESWFREATAPDPDRRGSRPGR